ncbi:MAG: motility protein A [Lachnospiraceae bacterium]|nr:motility protein A [Lachnospiraceae bacterium]
MDLASIIGLAVCVAMMLLGIVTGDDGVAGLRYFIDVKSVLITLGGAFFAVLASNSIKDFIGGLKSFLLIFKSPSMNLTETISKVIELSNVARKEGLLALEEVSGELEDPFLKKGILLIVDGTDPELVRGILETEVVNLDSRHRQKIAFWQDLGAMGPAWGMIGTLIGLILMLQNMSDASSIGPSMSVALITTLYGSVLANWICTPTSNKLKSNNEAELMLKDIMIEGLLSIQAGENPRVIEEKLKSFLPPSERASAESEEGGEG